MPRASKPKRLARLIPAAEYGQVTPKTLRNWIAAGRITAYRNGPKLLMVDLDELDRLVRPVASAGRGAA